MITKMFSNLVAFLLIQVISFAHSDLVDFQLHPLNRPCDDEFVG